MENLDSKKLSTAYSFKQLIKIKKNKYFKENDFKSRQEIALKFICDPNISSDFLDKYITNCLKEKSDSNDIYNRIDNLYSLLKFSLPKEKNYEYYTLIRDLEPNLADTVYKYLAFNDPIDNFKNIYNKYSLFINEQRDKTKTNINLEKIEKYIDEMTQVYNKDLQKYYFPPMEEYPIYVYNFYSFLFYKTLKKFKDKKIVEPFNSNKKNISQYTDMEKKMMNYLIGLFFQDVNKIFLKFNYENIQKDLKALKIIFFYFQNFEYLKNYSSFRDIFLKIINCIDSEPITGDILKRFKFFRKNSKIFLTEKEWNSIGINEIVYIDNNPIYPVKIKHFKKDILNLDNIPLLNSLLSHSIDDLNIDGLIQNSIIKFDDKIEGYTKKLLQSIFSSEMYRNYFLSKEKGLDAQDLEKARLIENILKGENSKIIFEEFWNNIFYLPFPDDQDLLDYNNIFQNAIFINSNPKINSHSTFQKIIPRFHSDINKIFNEFTNHIVLIIAANLEEDISETLIKNDNEELYNIQKEYSKKYNQNNLIYKKFDDFGSLMEVKMFGIRLRKYKTFAGLFCLDCNSYSLNSNDFKEICVGLYNLEIDNNNIKENLGTEKKLEKYDLKKLLENIMNSEFAKLLKEYFIVENGFKNESFIDDCKPREKATFMFNEEFSVNINYCDKLDKI